jgi:uncharacterized membrane protein
MNGPFMKQHYNRVAGQSLESLMALSNNIFAFAMTLLILKIQIPSHETIHTGQDLLNALYVFSPNILTWLMSVLTLGLFWVGQHTQFNHLKHSNLRYTWLQLGFLACVTAMPFTTELLTEFMTFRLALLVYWANILILGIFLFVSLVYANKNDLVKENFQQETYRLFRRRTLTSQTLYAIGATLCVINTYWSIGFILLVQLNYAVAPKIPWICEITVW